MYDQKNTKAKTKHKTLITLEDATIDGDIGSKLLARDNRIAKLNEIILELRGRLKEAENETISRKLKQRINLLEDENCYLNEELEKSYLRNENLEIKNAKDKKV